MLIQNLLFSHVPQITKSRRVASQCIKSETASVIASPIKKENKLVATFNKIITFIKSNIIKCQKTDLEKLLKLPLNEFVVEAQKLIAKSKGYDLEIIAPISIQPLGNPKVAMMYDAGSNLIVINSENKLKPGIKMFSQLCHEYEHMNQNFQILRTKGLGEKTVEFYSKNLAKETIDVFCERFKNVKPEELPKMREQLGDNYEYVLSYVKALNEGKDSLKLWYDCALKNEYNVFKKEWDVLREKIVKSEGEIKPNTKEAKEAERYSNDFQIEGSLTGLKKNFTSVEFRAYFVQFLNYYYCLIKKFF